MAAAAKANKDGYIKIGEFAGFDIMAVQTKEGIKGLLRGNQGYSFRFYPEQTTRMISNLQKLVSGLDTYAEEQQGRLADINSEITAQSALMQQPFAKQEEMDKKLSRYNEIMAELNPKEEQAISEDEDGEEETQYSRRGKPTGEENSSFEEDKYFSRQMDRWNELSDGNRVKVGTVQSGSALNQVGLQASGLYFDVGKIKKALQKHSDHLTPEVMKHIPGLLNDPIVITEYKGVKNTVNVYGNLFVNGHPVVVGIVMRLDSSGNNIINVIRTVHARSDVAHQITDETVLYLNENKKTTRKWFQVCGNLNVPLDETKFGLVRSISHVSEVVNRANSTENAEL